MLERLLAIERASRWAEIRQLGTALLAGLSGDNLARANLTLAKAVEETAASPVDYRQAARYVQAAVVAAVPGSFMHTWSLARAAAMLSDVGEFKQAGEAARAFLAQVAAHPKAEAMLPWVHFAMGQVHYYERRPGEAAHHFRLVKSTGANGAISELAQIWQAWALAAAGSVVDAFAAIPNDVQHISRGHIFAAMARVCLAAQDWQGAQANARAALQSSGEWAVHDSLQVAELRLILDRCATELQHRGAGAVRFDTAATLALCSEAVLIVLAASLGQAGGERYEAADSSRGLPGGYKRTGLLGTVG